VPKQAVYPNETGEPHVYKVTGDEAQSMPVKVGVQAGDKAEILEGVNEGDTIVVSGGYGLPEKSKVHVKP
jgi:multidrug efflux pump subunit AcrA (membrane-fusion protein)